ncbi:MAG: hypothetical protein QOJ99_5584 [Bryobacterales bacterium]|nr:hypothetical protein [Bryobacterales bacterium]
MTTVTIDLPDQQAATLRAKAAAAGLTLEAWLMRLAEAEVRTSRKQGRYSLAELMQQCDQNAPLSDEDRAWIDAPAVGREAL